MKILIASDTYKFQTNGVVTVLITLIESLRQLGHDVKVLSPANGRASFRKGDEYYLRSIPAGYYPDQRLCLTRHDPLLDELKIWKPDLIHLHTEGMIGRLAIHIASDMHIPLIMTTHTDYARFAFGRYYDLRLVRGMAKTLGKAFYPHAEAIIAPTEKAREYAWLETYLDRVVVIPSGIHLERFQKSVTPKERTDLMEQYGLNPNGFTMVIVSRISREKNIIEILHAMKVLLQLLPNAQLVIVGDGPDRKRLEGECARLDLNDHVCFTGRVNVDEVYRFYALGDVFVSASTFEAQGLTYLEAMACGLPVVCREDPCLKNVLICGRNGFTYDNEHEFVQAILKIQGDKDLWTSMHDQALAKAEEYSDACFAKKTEQLYEHVIAGFYETT